MKEFLKKIRYLLEAAITKFAMWCFYIMGPQNASNSAAFLARVIGKKHSTQKLALQNLSKAFPDLDEKAQEKIIDGMWDNLGRVIGEFVHLARTTPQEMMQNYLTIDKQSQKNIAALKLANKGGIIFSGHIGNWEAGPKSLISQGLDVNTVYRPLNNSYVEKMTAPIRGSKLITKGLQGSRQIIEALKRQEYVIILMDQKISEGEPVPFFGEDAATATSIARIALKYDVPLIPARVIRLGREFKFVTKVEAPLAYHKTGDLDKDIYNLTLLINHKLEKWIAEYPSQWFWVHNRWKK